MAGFERGVRYYTTVRVQFHFPEDRVCCDFCPLMETYARKQCRVSGEYLADTRTVGYACPLQPEPDEMNLAAKEKTDEKV